MQIYEENLIILLNALFMDSLFLLLPISSKNGIPCSAQNAANHNGPKFLQQPRSNDYNMVA